jgi:hypothetical protein
VLHAFSLENVVFHLVYGSTSRYRISRIDSQKMHFNSYALLIFPNLLIHNHYYYFVRFSICPFLLFPNLLFPVFILFFNSALSLFCHVFLNGRNTVFLFHGSATLVVLGLLTVEVSRSYSDTPHSRRVIGPSQRLLPNNTQQSQETDVHAARGIRTHNLSKGAASGPCLRPRGHRYRHLYFSY